MTWLATQVWLWSAAAFVLGALFTWLLFVQPLRRRLRAATDRPQAESVRPEPAVRPELPDTPDFPERPTEASWQFDPADFASADVPEVPAASAAGPEGTARDLPHPARHEEPTLGDWDRPPRAWASQPPEEFPWETPVSRQPVSGFEDTSAIQWSAATPFDDSELRLEEQREPADQERSDPDWAGPMTSEGPMTPPAEPTAPAEIGPEPEPNQANTWFQKAARFDDEASEQPPRPRWSDMPDAYEWSGTLDVPDSRPDTASMEETSELSGQLRSLFEPLVAPGIDHERVDTPYVPPVGVEPPQHLADLDGPVDRNGTLAGSPAPELDAESPPPLPRRTPGASPRPGAENFAAPADRPANPRPSAEHMIKGHFASGQYHTPDSPQYDRIAAEVWFRTAADAEQAGFEPWDARGPDDG